MFFVDPASMSWDQLLWAFCSYGYVLYVASSLISDGSELLLLVPQLAGIVGGIVLPILGAVPDGMMVLFSGLDPDLVAAQHKLNVGIGSQAGSTVMVLTIPLFCAVWGGRVDIKDGACNYHPGKDEPKLTNKFSLFGSGVQPAAQSNATARMMLFTVLTYFIIQIPALFADTQGSGDPTEEQIRSQAKFEAPYALVGCIVCVIQFARYLRQEYIAGMEDAAQDMDSQKSEDAMQPAISTGLSARSTRLMSMKMGMVTSHGLGMYLDQFRRENKLGNSESASMKLLEGKKVSPHMLMILGEFYKKYKTSKQGIDKKGFSRLVEDLSLNYSATEIDRFFDEVDSVNEPMGWIDQEEFIECFKRLAAVPPSCFTPQLPEVLPKGDADEDDEDEEDEEEEMPEDFKNLPPNQQRCRILFRSAWMMLLGTLLVLVFSDPMVDVLSALGDMSGIPSFYIAFVLAPIAANASELVASYNYSCKKTASSIGISMSTLQGAGCMNNTYVLGIFFAVMYTQGLAWKFTAESITIVFIEVAVYLILTYRSILTVADGMMVLCLHPLAMLMVYLLENIVGLD